MIISAVLAAVVSAAMQAPAAVQPTLPTAAEVQRNPVAQTPPTTSDARAAADIRALERRWGRAFVDRDFAFLEQIIAPEFRLVSMGPDGAVGLTSRVDWMRNSRAFQHLGFTEEVIDVMTAGDTAVAIVRGSWTVKRFADRPASVTQFVVTDTWVRRNGRWQVAVRYSQRLPRPGPAKAD